MVSIKCASQEDKSKNFKEKSVKFAEAIDETFNQMIQGAKFKLINPFYLPFYRKTGKSLSMTKLERVCDENCKRLRKFVSDYVMKRK